MPDSIQTSAKLEAIRATLGEPPARQASSFTDTAVLSAWINNRGNTISNLREYATLMGVEETYVYRVRPLELAKAYRSPAYLARLKQSSHEPKPVPRHAFRKAVDLSLDSSAVEFSEALQQSEETEESEQSEQSEPGAAKPAKLDSAAIARAADSVIGPKLRLAEQKLAAKVDDSLAIGQKLLQNRLDQALRDFKVPQEQIENISRIAYNVAKAAAKKIVDENLPRRLEITFSDHKIELPAEPRHCAFNEIFRWLSTQTHVYMVGPKGSGKTHLFKQLAQALGYDLETEFFPIDQSLTKYDVKGFKNPLGEYVPTLVYRAVKFGGFMVIDEGDMWAAAALGALNSILANDFGAFADEIVKVHPRFLCVVAANTYGHGADRQYQGRNPLDAASLDRFAFVEVDYDPAMERLIYGDTPWLRYVHKVRAAAKQLALPHMVPSMRAIAKGHKGYAVGLPPDKVAFGALWTGAAPDTVAKIVQIVGAPPARQPIELDLSELDEALSTGTES